MKKRKSFKKRSGVPGRTYPKNFRVPRSKLLIAALREGASQKIRLPQRDLAKSVVVVRSRPERRRGYPLTKGVRDVFRRKTRPVLMAEGLNRAIRNTHQELRKAEICRKRENRRKALFAQGVAGRGRRRSPGKFGTYQKDQTSTLSCKH